MQLSGSPGLQTELSSRQIRAITARIAHPEEPLVEWRLELEEWRRAYSEFQQMERERFLRAEPPTAVMLREHRYVLFLLMTQGEGLALSLMQASGVEDAERTSLLEQVEASLGSLCDSWHTWHGEALPEHRQALASFFS